MKEINLMVSENNIEDFKTSCEVVSGISFISYKKGIATLEYKYDFNLFYLGNYYSIETFKNVQNELLR